MDQLILLLGLGCASSKMLYYLLLLLWVLLMLPKPKLDLWMSPLAPTILPLDTREKHLYHARDHEH